jgi:hypothetical protein
MRVIQYKFQTRQAEYTISNISASVTFKLTVLTVMYPHNLSLIEPFSVSRKLVKKERKCLQNILSPIQINVLMGVYKFC